MNQPEKSQRRVVEVCPSCFSTVKTIRGYAPNLAHNTNDPEQWPPCKDPWHEDQRDSWRACFNAEDLEKLAESFNSSQV